MKHLLLCITLLLATVSLATAAVTIPLPETGQTKCYRYSDNAMIDCTFAEAGQDGAWQKGVAWPSPRFVDNANGTITDNLTGLVWLKNGNCTDTAGGVVKSGGTLTWQNGLTWSNALASGSCGLIDDSTPGQWRLPNEKELMSLVNWQEANIASWLNLPAQGFTGVQASVYWSASTYAGNPVVALGAKMYDGGLYGDGKSGIYYVWPVRAGQSGTLVHLNIVKDGHGTGSVTPNSGTIEWNGNTGLGHYLENGTVILTATPTPDSDSVFYGWSGACTGTGTCSVTMDAVKDVTATFGLSGVCGGANGVPASAVPSQNLCDKGVASTPTGSGPWNWTCDGYEGGSNASCSAPILTWPLAVTVTGAGTVHSTPTPDIACTGGCSQNYDHGTVVTLTGTPGSGQIFTGWTGDCSGTGTCQVTMDAAKSVTATFTLSVVTPSPAPVPMTGQTLCYDVTGGVISCAGTGQDGETLTGVAWPNPRFTDNSIAAPADLTVTDNLTGLIWTKNANFAFGPWQEALDYIKGLNSSNYQGHNDWRLPNQNELESLVNKGQGSTATWMNTQGFTNVQAYYYWSSSTYTNYTTNYAWLVRMSDGHVSYDDKTSFNYVWPVRGGQSGASGSLALPKTGQTACYDTTGTSRPCSGTGEDGELQAGAAWPSTRFTDNSIAAPADLTVSDNLTGLVWTKNANLAAGTKTWQQALDYIQTLNTGSGYLGHTDWRLPNFNELASLVNKGQGSTATWLNTQGFTNVRANWYWSSSTYAGSTVYAWYVDMHDGDVYASLKTSFSNYYVWPVRAGQSGPLVNLNITPNPVSFGNQILGTPAATTIITVTNSGVGDVPLIVNSLSLSGQTPEVFAVAGGGTTPCGALPFSINAGESCTLAVTFNPSTAGNKSATLAIASNDPITPNVNVPLSGISVVQEYVLSVAMNGAGSGVVHSTPGTDINCTTGSCTKPYDLDTLVTLTATTNSGSTFSAWTGCDSVNGSVCTVTVNGMRNVEAGFASTGATVSWFLPQTGQSTCYDTAGSVIPCAGTGQDGDTLTGAQWPTTRFIDNSDQTMTDRLTGLIWAKDAYAPGPYACGPSTAKNWQGALDYVKCLNVNGYLGYSDWQLPNVNELRSILNGQHSEPESWLSAQGFSNVYLYFNWWTSTSSHYNSTSAITAGSTSGYVDIGNRNKSELNLVWPVRPRQLGFPSIITLPKTGQTGCWDATGNVISCSDTGQDGELRKGAAWPSPRFYENIDQTITDKLTGLVWPKDLNTPGPAACNPATTKTWQGALDYVNCLNTNSFLNFSDWRLPNANELRSLMNAQEPNPNWLNSQGFINSSQTSYWSSSTLSFYSSGAFYLSLDGHELGEEKTFSYYAIPVRGNGELVTPGSPEITVSLTTITFSPTATYSTTSQPLAITAGGTRNLIVSSVAVSGANPGDFSVAPGTCSSTTPTLIAGTSCALDVIFAPKTIGSKAAKLTIISNATNSPVVTIALTGTAYDPPPFGFVQINSQATRTNSRDVTLALAAFDNSGQVAEMRFSNNNSSWTGWEPYLTSKAWQLLPLGGDGQKTVYVQFKDAANNASGSFFATIILDTTPPVITINSMPNTLYTSANGTFTFVANETVSDWQCKIDSGAFAPCSSPFTFSGLADGPHTFTVQAIDLISNSSTTSYTWTIDTTPPDTTITSKPTNPSSQASGSFTFSGSEAGVTFQCSLNNAAWSTCSASFTFSGLADGNHNLKVRATDPAGNLGNTASYSWTINTSTPQNVKIDGSGSYYATLNDALGGFTSGTAALLKARDIEYIEDINLNRCGETVTFDGGYDAAFSAKTGQTSVKGTITITCGLLIADGVVVK